MFVDSHCHLDFPEFAGELPALLASMREHAVTHALCIGVDLPAWPYVEAIAQAHAQTGTLQVGKMDIDKSPTTPTKYEVRSIPTLLLFHKGKVVGQLVGAVPKAKLEQFVKDALAKTAPTA